MSVASYIPRNLKEQFDAADNTAALELKRATFAHDDATLGVGGAQHKANSAAAAGDIRMTTAVTSQVFDGNWPQLDIYLHTLSPQSGTVWAGYFYAHKIEYGYRNRLEEYDLLTIDTAAVAIASVDTTANTMTLATTKRGFPVGTPVRFGGTPPSPLVAGTTYYVFESTDLDDGTIDYADHAPVIKVRVDGGTAAIDLTTAGSSPTIKIYQQQVRLWERNFDLSSGRGYVYGSYLERFALFPLNRDVAGRDISSANFDLDDLNDRCIVRLPTKLKRGGLVMGEEAASGEHTVVDAQSGATTGTAGLKATSTGNAVGFCLATTGGLSLGYLGAGLADYAAATVQAAETLRITNTAVTLPHNVPLSARRSSGTAYWLAQTLSNVTYFGDSSSGAPVVAVIQPAGGSVTDYVGGTACWNVTGTYLNACGLRILGLGDPTLATDAANKQYVDAAVFGLLNAKQSVRAATTANITLSGAQTIDGVSVIAGDRVLVKDQSSGANNGIYVAAAGSWTRATDFDASTEALGAFCHVREGTTLADTQWLCTNDSITIGTTALTFVQTAAPGQITASNVGSGSGVFKQKNGLSLEMKSLVNGSTDYLSMSANTDDITFVLNVGGDGTDAVSLAAYDVNGDLSPNNIHLLEGEVFFYDADGVVGSWFCSDSSMTYRDAGGAAVFNIPVSAGVRGNLHFRVDNTGAVVGTGTKTIYVRAPYDGVITKATLVAAQSGSIVVDVKKATYSGFPTFSSICASAKPTLSSARKSEDSTMTGWTLSFSQGDLFEITVDSATTVEAFDLYLDTKRTN